MSKKTDQHLLYAVASTVLACTLIFGLAWYIFAPGSITPSSPVIPHQSGALTIVPPTTTDSGIVKAGEDQSVDARVYTMEYDPVCGADGKTYGNTCTAHAAKTIVVSEGECIKSPKENTGNITDTSYPNESPSDVVNPAQNTETSQVDYTSTGKYQIYENKNFGYTISLPKYAYYQAYGSRDGANHTLALGLSEGDITDLTTAPVRVYFYKTIPATPPRGTEIKVPSGIIYVDGTISSPKIQTIIDTITQSAR